MIGDYLLALQSVEDDAVIKSLCEKYGIEEESIFFRNSKIIMSAYDSEKQRAGVYKDACSFYSNQKDRAILSLLVFSAFNQHVMTNSALATHLCTIEIAWYCSGKIRLTSSRLVSRMHRILYKSMFHSNVWCHHLYYLRKLMYSHRLIMWIFLLTTVYNRLI